MAFLHGVSSYAKALSLIITLPFHAIKMGCSLRKKILKLIHNSYRENKGNHCRDGGLDTGS